MKRKIITLIVFCLFKARKLPAEQSFEFKTRLWVYFVYVVLLPVVILYGGIFEFIEGFGTLLEIQRHANYKLNNGEKDWAMYQKF